MRAIKPEDIESEEDEDIRDRARNALKMMEFFIKEKIDVVDGLNTALAVISTVGIDQETTPRKMKEILQKFLNEYNTAYKTLILERKKKDEKL